MLNSFPANLLAGALLGTMAGLGLGGGSLLILWLTMVQQLPPENARFINLLFFIPAAVISTAIHIKKNDLSYRPLLPAIVCGSVAAIIFSRLSTIMDELMLKRLFGILLLITGLRELFYRPRKAR